MEQYNSFDEHRNEYPTHKSREWLVRYLNEMGEDWVERILSKENNFSSVLKTLGVGRKAFTMWMNQDMTRWERLGRKRLRPIWEDGNGRKTEKKN